MVGFFLNRFLGRVNDKGSAYKEFLIMTGIANPLTQVNLLLLLNNFVLYSELFRVGFEQFLKIQINLIKNKLNI